MWNRLRESFSVIVRLIASNGIDNCFNCGAYCLVQQIEMVLSVIGRISLSLSNSNAWNDSSRDLDDYDQLILHILSFDVSEKERVDDINQIFLK